MRELGLRYLRYGPPLHRVFLGPDKYDWSFMDQICQAMQELEMIRKEKGIEASKEVPF